MNIGLIDVDGHRFPNLALMKIGAYHKEKGDSVEWWNKNSFYDVVYMSKVFSDTYSPDVPEPLNARTIIKGGTGYAISLDGGTEVYHAELDGNLPEQMEHVYPMYELYPQFTKNTAYGFLTRGCPRQCGFCIVGQKEGCASRQVATLSEFWNGQKNIILLDPNILACPSHMRLLEELRDTKVWVNFCQGLDARLINTKNAELLAQIKTKDVRFAMDTMQCVSAVASGIKKYVDAVTRIKGKWNPRWARVFCLTNFNTTHAQDMERIEKIRELGCWPYVMIYNKPSAPMVTRKLQRWTNSPFVYFSTSNFEDFYKE